jgi:hypothetical protein
MAHFPLSKKGLLRKNRAQQGQSRQRIAKALLKKIEHSKGSLGNALQKLCRKR